MLLKFTPIRLNISINKDPNDPLFEVPQLNDFSTIESKIKNLFWWFRKEEGWIDIVNPKQYGDKYVVVKYYDKSTEKISLMEDLSKWKLLIMCLQIAEKNKINEFKEVVEDGKVQFRITTNQEIFEDYIMEYGEGNIYKWLSKFKLSLLLDTIILIGICIVLALIITVFKSNTFITYTILYLLGFLCTNLLSLIKHILTYLHITEFN